MLRQHKPEIKTMTVKNGGWKVLDWLVTERGIKSLQLGINVGCVLI